MKTRAPPCRYFVAEEPLPLTHPARRGRSPQPGGGRRHFMTHGELLAPASETDQLRQQLLQAQRLSSVGALASSVAHEFNNILTTIINYARLALRSAGDEASRTQALEKILKGSQRAATDLAVLIEEVLILTDKDLSKHRIHVEKKVHGRPRASVVPAQIEQVL